MLRHCVIMTWKTGTTPEAHDRVVEALRALPDRISAIGSYQVGCDVGLVDGNADLCVVADFAGEAEWRVYREDAEHQRVIAEQIRPILASRSVLQFEF